MPYLLAQLRASPRFMRNVTAWKRLPPRPARFAPWPADLDPRLQPAWAEQGIERLFVHQTRAVEAALRGQNLVVVTGTASGKSLCYLLPTMHTLLNDPAARALYLFPTKALTQDQLAGLDWVGARWSLDVGVYDGDTPRSQRAAVRRQARVLLTNPDMLHTGILPHHTRWADFFGNVQIVVLDEIHTYRGVFGSHLANVLRRLRRICGFYGRVPRFLLTSATIANPVELAQRLVGAPVTLVDDDGAPQGEKHLIFYNPPLVDPVSGVRRSATLEARDIAARFLAADVQTIFFARARLTTEVLLGYLRDEARQAGLESERVQGYRGGYLPLERRDIERGLRQGAVRAVVATNALELGIDIGQLSACVMVGYPGTIASTWQQAGRAGRRAGVSLAVLIAGPSALDQYMVRHPAYFLGRSPERGLIQPDNLVILLNHLRCAAFELPFAPGEGFGPFSEENLADLLTYLVEEEGVLHHSGGHYRWIGEGYPASQVSLRSGGPDAILILDQSGQVVGQVDRPSAPMLVFQGAVYLHGGESYLVDRLDWEAGQAFVRRSELDYYTQASIGDRVEVLEVYEQTPPGAGDGSAGAWGRAYGEVLVTSEALGFRQIKRYTHETLGWGEIDLPEQTVMTAGAWLWVSEAACRQLQVEGVLALPLDYGPNWAAQREAARQRDGYRCRTCGAPERPDRQHDVHHLRPFREFGYRPGENQTYLQANALDNLITLCQRCHRRAETAQRVGGALSGLAHALNQIAPLYLMCDPRDLGGAVEMRSAHTRLPTITLYDRVPGGIGLSAQLYDLFDPLLKAAGELISGCACQSGCPACVGPGGELSPTDVKGKTLRLLEMILE